MSEIQYRAYQPKSFNPHNKWVAVIFWTQGKKGITLKDIEGREYLYDSQEQALKAAKLIIEGSHDVQ